jgi:hypothetical protein
MKGSINTKFKSPVIKKIPSRPQQITTKNSRNEVVELQKLIRKWKDTSQELLLDLQTKETLQDLAQSLRFDIQVIGKYDLSQDCFVE